MHRVVALAVSEVVAFDLSIPAQVFGHDDAAHLYDFAVCTERPGLVPTTTGFELSIRGGLELLVGADTVIVPGFLPTTDPSPVVLDALRTASASGSRVASVCVGTFALAAAGLLDGRAATTHWQHAEQLRQRFPAVDVRSEVLYVDAGEVLSSAGIAAGIDLCLHMVRRDHGEAAATKASRRMVAALYRPGGQAQFIDRPVPEEGSLLAEACEWALARLDEPLTVADLATRSASSERSFSRQFRAHHGMSPGRWLTAQRVLEARRLLEMSDLSVDEIAGRCGLGTSANLRTHFARAVDTTPSEYRRAFRQQRVSPGT